MKKTWMLMMLVVMTGVFTTGCLQLKKTPASTNKFISVAEAESMKVQDMSTEFHTVDPDSEESGILEVTAAYHPDGWKVEFCKYTDAETAKKEFDENHEGFQEEEPTGMEKSVEAGNYKGMYLSENGEFIYLSYIEDSVVYAKGDQKYEKDIREFIKKLNY